jgi:hypothetical protein
MVVCVDVKNFTEYFSFNIIALGNGDALKLLLNRLLDSVNKMSGAKPANKIIVSPEIYRELRNV